MVCKDKEIFSPARRGFTFVELLLVCAMLGVVSLSIFAVFSNGIKIWRRLNQPLREAQVGVLFDKFGFDLRNSFKFSNIDFCAEPDSLAFAAIVNSPRLKKMTVGQVIYSFDADTRTLNREQKDFVQIYADQRGTVTPLIEGVASVTFENYYYDEQQKEYLWRSGWRAPDLPQAVRMRLELYEEGETIEFTKTVDLPAADS